MKEKGFLGCYIIYCLAMVIDIGITLYNYQYLPAVEINPLYRLFMSMWPMILLNSLIVLFFFWWYYRERTSVLARFVCILLMVVIILARIMFLPAAIHYVVDRPPVEQVMVSVTEADRAVVTRSLTAMMYSPIFIGLLAFWIWKQDHDISRSNEVILWKKKLMKIVMMLKKLKKKLLRK